MAGRERTSTIQRMWRHLVKKDTFIQPAFFSNDSNFNGMEFPFAMNMLILEADAASDYRGQSISVEGDRTQRINIFSSVSGYCWKPACWNENACPVADLRNLCIVAYDAAYFAPEG